MGLVVWKAIEFQVCSFKWILNITLVCANRHQTGDTGTIILVFETRVAQLRVGLASTSYTISNVDEDMKVFNEVNPLRMEVLLYPMFPYFWKSIAFCGFPVLALFSLLVRTACCLSLWSFGRMVPTGKNGTHGKKWYPREKIKISVEKLVPVPLCPSQICHRLAWAMARPLKVWPLPKLYLNIQFVPHTEQGPFSLKNETVKRLMLITEIFTVRQIWDIHSGVVEYSDTLGWDVV